MFYDLYMFDHNILHICFWTLPAILVGVIMVVMSVWHNRNQKKRQQEFEEEMTQGQTPANPEAVEPVQA